MNKPEQRYVQVLWASEYISIFTWYKAYTSHIVLTGSSKIPTVVAEGVTIPDAINWLEDKDPSLIDMWEEELSIYQSIKSQVSLPVMPMDGTRRLTYTLPLRPDNGPLGLVVEVNVGYKELGGPYATASLYVNIDDSDEEQYSKTIVKHYCLDLPIDCGAVWAAVKPGIAYLADSISKLTFSKEIPLDH